MDKNIRLQFEVSEAYRNHIRENIEENKNGAASVKERLEHSPLAFNGMLDKTLQVPKVFDSDTISDFRRIADITYKIFGKVVDEYRSNAEYRALFPFSKELEELILLPRQYDGFLPIARFDLFYNEQTGDFYFCEINTDGTAAMLRDLELGKALICNPAHQAVIRQYELKQFELFDSFIREFMRLYGTYPKKKEHPNIAIVDFLENATLRDFEEFARRFQKKGYNCEICDIRSLRLQDGELYSENGNRIDAIYRRAVTADVMEHFDEVTTFIDAIRSDAVFFAGAFDTQILHTKWLFYVLHREETRSILTKEENEFVKKHIPHTTLLDERKIDLDEVKKHKDDYMIKPMDSYSSKGIYAAGKEYSEEDWNELVMKFSGKGYICQQYCPQYETENIDFAWGDGKWHSYINMPGLYVYNGVFSGVLMRTTVAGEIIVAHENERTLPVFEVLGKIQRRE